MDMRYRHLPGPNHRAQPINLAARARAAHHHSLSPPLSHTLLCRLSTCRNGLSGACKEHRFHKPQCKRAAGAKAAALPGSVNKIFNRIVDEVRLLALALSL